ncbi:MAG: hypothetical protein U0K48_05930 [Bacilli bacterium]|jgi:hypothetical protein|nr:hypothetical protein [Bacilli bacterium]DAE91212.1 MAG TPA: Major capsid protein [Caudoviricetes sp.]
MANSIAKFKKYVPLLDEVYKNSALTSILDSDDSLAKAGANANEIIIPKIDMDALGDYDRNSGYTNGDVTMTNETVKFNYERGRMFTVDAMDDEETAGLAYGRLASEFIRTKVAPEGDAFRFATYAGVSGISKVATPATLSTGADVISALRAATNKMDEDEVPYENRILFITPTLKGLVDDLDTTKSKEVLARFSQIVLVPQTRFYTAIDMLDGKTSGETKGGYKRHAKGSDTGDTNGADINFMVIHKGAVMQYNKHIAPKVITPEANQTSDGWKFGYRKYGLADVYENKVAGIYLHHKAAPTA